jgi:hypothetical protein
MAVWTEQPSKPLRLSNLGNFETFCLCVIALCSSLGVCCLFQLHAMISHSVDVNSVGLGSNANLLSSLKQHVVELASSIGVLNTIQSAAQATLQAGWSILLPTADERAKTLSALLPSTGNIHTYAICINSVRVVSLDLNLDCSWPYCWSHTLMTDIFMVFFPLLLNKCGYCSCEQYRAMITSCKPFSAQR